jgi:energy-coupling factor transport system substrate-specific component
VWPYQPGLGTLTNLHRFVSFDLATSMGFDLTRAVTAVVMIVVLGRPVLAARRASRRAVFEPEVAFTGGGGAGQADDPSTASRRVRLSD